MHCALFGVVRLGAADVPVAACLLSGPQTEIEFDPSPYYGTDGLCRAALEVWVLNAKVGKVWRGETILDIRDDGVVVPFGVPGDILLHDEVTDCAMLFFPNQLFYTVESSNYKRVISSRDPLLIPVVEDNQQLQVYMAPTGVDFSIGNLQAGMIVRPPLERRVVPVVIDGVDVTLSATEAGLNLGACVAYFAGGFSTLIPGICLGIMGAVGLLPERVNLFGAEMVVGFNPTESLVVIAKDSTEVASWVGEREVPVVSTIASVIADGGADLVPKLEGLDDAVDAGLVAPFEEAAELVHGAGQGISTWWDQVIQGLRSALKAAGGPILVLAMGVLLLIGVLLIGGRS